MSPDTAARVEAIAKIISPKVWKRGRIDDGDGWIEPIGRQRSIDQAKRIIDADPATSRLRDLEEQVRVMREGIQPIYDAVSRNAAPMVVDYALSQVDRIDLDPPLLRDLFDAFATTDAGRAET